MINDDDKKRIEAQAAAYMTQVFRDGDWTESLAAFYAAAQALERIMQERFELEPRYLLHIQLVGKRVGVAMAVKADIDFVPSEDVN